MVTILGVAVFLGYKNGIFFRPSGVTNLSPQETMKAFCKEGFCINYNDSQIEVAEGFKSKDIEIFSFDQIGKTRYLDEIPLMVLRIVASKNSIEQYIADNQNYCDEVAKTTEETGGPTDCHRFTKINQEVISGNTFAKVHESGGGGSTSSLDFLIMNNSKVYEFSCNPSSEQEFEWLDTFDIEKLKLFERSETFATCLSLISGFSLTK